MKALIFGANGQDGYYLRKYLETQDIEVMGISRSGDFPFVDLTSFDAIRELLASFNPDYIFHLAANSTTRHDAWAENHATISTGTMNLLEAAKRALPDARIFISGSGLQFKNTGKPISESDPFEPTSPYAVSRIHSVYAARYYRNFGMKIYAGYFFNHDSPLRSEKHVTKKITEAVKRISAGDRQKLEIGNVHVRKEWGYAGDIVKGIWTLVQQDNVFEAVIGTGKDYSIKDWLEVCFAEFGYTWQDHVTQVPGFVSEYSTLVSNPTLINSLGWKPEVSFKDLAKMMLH